MIHTLADISTKGNPVEGAILVVIILVVIVGVAYKLSSRARNGLNTTIGRNPRSKVLQYLFGTRNR